MYSRSTTYNNLFDLTTTELSARLLETQSRLQDLTKLRDDLITEQEYFQNEVTSTQDSITRSLFLDVMQTRGWALQDVKVFQVE